MSETHEREHASATSEHLAAAEPPATPPFSRAETALAARAIAALDSSQGTVSWIGVGAELIAGGDTLATFLGHHSADLHGERWLRALDPTQRREASRAVRRVLDSQAPITARWRFLRAAGDTLPMRVTVRPLRASDDDRPFWLCVALQEPDVETNAPDARAEALDAMAKSIADGLIEYDATGAVRRANGALRSLLSELGVKDIAALDVNAAPLPDSVEGLRQALRGAWRRIMAGETLTGGTAVEVTVTISDDAVKEFSISGGPTRDAHGAIDGVVALIHDVTAQREGDRERIRALSFVAHELRNPLTSMKLSLDLAIHRYEKGAPIEPAALTLALDGIKQVERMVEDLVDAARSDNQKFRLIRERCDMRELCAQAAEEQRSVMDRSVRYDPPAEALWVDVDRVRIRQVLSNLLSNALKYSPPDTTVDLLAERRGDHVWVGVRDRGPGVPPEAQERLFQAFYRAPDAHAPQGQSAGLGLGLFLCKRFVELHRGKIGFTTGPRDGSLFWFTLAAAPEAEAPAEAASKTRVD